MKAVAWIRQAQPSAPERLTARVTEVLASNPEWDRLSVTEALLRAGAELLEDVLHGGAEPARERALDLLAADACVTWAFEVAADDPSTLSEWAQRTMARLQKVVA